jgi:DNA-binding protein H-NS
MSEKLKALRAQQAELNKQIEALVQADRKGAIEQALGLIKDYQLTQQDLFGGVTAEKTTKTTTKVPAKYRDPVTKKEWSGRGMTPKWIKDSGKEMSEFLIKRGPSNMVEAITGKY